MTDELPPYVAYMDTAVTRLETSFTAALERMATKSDLALMQERLDNEVRAREQLQADLRGDEAERHRKMARMWGAIWAGFGTVIIAASTIVAALVSIHH